MAQYSGLTKLQKFFAEEAAAAQAAITAATYCQEWIFDHKDALLELDQIYQIWKQFPSYRDNYQMTWAMAKAMGMIA